MASSHLIPVASGLTPSGILSTGVPAASAFPALLGPVFFQPTVTPLRGGAGGEGGGGGGSGGGPSVPGQSAIYAPERYENYEKQGRVYHHLIISIRTAVGSGTSKNLKVKSLHLYICRSVKQSISYHQAIIHEDSRWAS